MNIKYRAVTPPCDAFQMTVDRIEHKHEWPEWLRQAYAKEPWTMGSLFRTTPNGSWRIGGPTEGVYTLGVNDWVVLTVKGDLFPVVDHEFAKYYEVFK